MTTAAVSNVLTRLRRLIPQIEKEETRRRKWDAWLRSVMRDGLAGANETALRSVLSKRYAAPVKRSITLTPARIRDLRVQARYMGYLQHLPSEDAARVKALKEKEGMRAAAALARKLSKARKQR